MDMVRHVNIDLSLLSIKRRFKLEVPVGALKKKKNLKLPRIFAQRQIQSQLN
jgi:hypothetical protein